MPLTIDNPITIPARPALSCDKLAVHRLTIYRGIGLQWSANAEVCFYAVDEAGNPIFALDEAGYVRTESLTIPDLYGAAAGDATLANAITAILAAVGDLYAAKVAAESNSNGQNQSA